MQVEADGKSDVLPLRKAVSMLRSLRSCKDCGSTTRALKAPGPRCATCQRAVTKARKEAAWAAGILKRYGITPEQYWALYEAQGGSCYICEIATGKTKKLSVDHDHATGYVRGLLCTPCNKMLGLLRDDPDKAYRMADYLAGNTPASRVIGKVKPGESD